MTCNITTGYHKIGECDTRHHDTERGDSDGRLDSEQRIICKTIVTQDTVNMDTVMADKVTPATMSPDTNIRRS